jgi:cell division protein FtsW
MKKLSQLKASYKPIESRFDFWLLVAAIALVGFGVVMVASASMPRGALRGDEFRYVDRHLIAVLMGVMGAVFVYFTPVEWWKRYSTHLYILGLLLLAIVFIPGLGVSKNGATRWVVLGPISLQTSEFMKLFVVLFLAGYLVRRQLEVAHTVWGVAKPFIVLVVACIFLMLQPDLGTTVLLLAVALGLLFLAGAPLWQFGALLALAAAAVSVILWTSPWRLERVKAFLNPWDHAQDSGWQLTQALIAFGRGEWTGVGLGNGIQKQFHLPEAHTDFVMAVIGEELGLIGTLTIVALFGVLVWRALSMGATAEKLGKRFEAYVAYGLGIWLGLQAFINIGVNMGLMPTKGFTLPFISYGSNSLIVSCVAIGMLSRIYRDNQLDPGSRPKGAAWQRA